jgi:hypothetical protein
MVVYSPVAPTYRTPVRLVVVGGQPLTRVFSSRVTRGWDQELATAELLIPYPPPSNVGHRAMIRVYMGVGAQPVLRFTGYITSLNLTVWPGRVLLGCEDMLALAKYYRPSSSVSLEGLTDQAAVVTILQQVGLPIVSGLIGGTGKTLGDDDEANPALLWEPTTTALAKIQEIDQISVFENAEGHQSIYRTYCDAGGQIRRIPLHPLPASAPAHTFTEGTDIEQGSVSIEAVEPSKVATAAGAGGLSVTLTGTNPWATLSNPAFGIFPLVGVVDGGGTAHDLNGMAAYLLQQVIANLLRIDVTLRRDDLIGAYETDRVIAPHALVDIKALVQSVTTEMSESGGFTQQLSLISHRELNIAEDTLPEFDPFDGDEIPVDDGPILPEPVDEEAVLPSFNVNIVDKEVELIDGAYTANYSVSCEDTSTSAVGEIVAWAWEASAPGTPATGTEPRFTASWPGDLTGATVTLTVTDSLGNVASTPPIAISEAMGAPVRVRKLYTAETDAIAAFDGTQWRSFTPTGRGTVTVVANGPYWGTSLGWFLSTADDLASAPTEYDVTTNGEISAIWAHETQVGYVVVGTSAGTLYATPDGGATWGGPGGGSVGGGKFGPDGGNPDGSVPIRQVVVSIHDVNEWQVLTPTGWYRSPDAGASWVQVRAPATGQSFTALRLSGWRNLVASTITAAGAVLEAGEEGTPFTFPDTPTGITGIAFNIYADEVCAISGDTPPKLYVTDAAGSATMAAAETVDLTAYTGAAPHPRNLQHDGSIARQVYAAVGSHALKSTDFFKADSVHVLRHVGEGGAGAGPITMIGMGDLGGAPGGAAVIYVASGNGLYVYDRTADTWTDISPVAGWPFHAVAAAGDHVWAVQTDTIHTLHHSADAGQTWATVALPGTDGTMDTLSAADDGATLVAVFNNDASSANNGVWTRPVDGTGAWSQARASGSTFIFNGDVAGSRLWLAIGGATRTFAYQTPVAGGSLTTVSGATGAGGTSAAISIVPSDATKAYACVGFDFAPGPGKVFRCDGSTGTDISPPGLPSSGAAGIVDVVSPNDQIVLALFWNNTSDLHEIYRSTDQGATWSVVHSVTHASFNDFPALRLSRATAGLVVAAWGTMLAISSDNGATWTDSSVGQAAAAIALT